MSLIREACLKLECGNELSQSSALAFVTHPRAHLSTSSPYQTTESFSAGGSYRSPFLGIFNFARGEDNPSDNLGDISGRPLLSDKSEVLC